MKLQTKILAINAKLDYWDKFKPHLDKAGFDLSVIDNGEQALQKLNDNRYELVILDSSVPDIDYLQLIQQLKDISQVPVIVIDNSNEASEAIVSLELGADDYISAPVNPRELIARIKSNLRLVSEAEERVREHIDAESQKTGKSENVYSFGKWTIDRDKMQVLRDDDSIIDLTGAEYELLDALVMSSGQVLSRAQLFQLTRGEELEAFDRAIDILIARIRKKLDESSQKPVFLKTVHGTGYMLDAEVKQVTRPR